MTLAKPGLNYKQALKVVTVGAGVFLFLAPCVKAVELSKNDTNTAEALSLRSNSSTLAAVQICSSERRWATAETKHYKVYICGKRTPAEYIGVAKDGSGNISLPISSYTDDVYTAKKNGHTYILDMKKLQLVITLPNGKHSIEKVIHTQD